MNSRLTCGYRKKSPCLNCEERFRACSDKCPKDARNEYGYNAWITELRGVQENRRKYYENRRKKW